MIRAIGSAATRFPKRMLAALTLALMLFGVVGGGVEERLSVGGFVDPNAESTKVADALENRFETGAYGFVLVLRPFEEWVYSESNRPEGERITTAIEDELGVVEVASYYNLPEPAAPATSPLRDGSGNYALVAVKLEGSEDEQRLTAARLYETYVEPGNERFEVRSTGAVEVSRAAAEEAEKDLQRAELLAIPVTLLGLLLVFRGWRAALLPLVVALFAVLGSFFALTLVVQVTEISIFARTLVTALGLGLSIDYSLLMVARFRDERGRGLEVAPAVSRMLQTAGRTVLFSAATVASSLVGLLVFPVVYLRSFAYAGVAVVATAALAAVLVVPPALVLFGHRMGAATATRESFWGRQAARVMKHPVRWMVAVGGLLVLLGLPFLGFEPGRVDERVLPADHQARMGAEIIRSEMSWPDVNPIQVLVSDIDADDTDAVAAFTQDLLAMDGVIRVDSSQGFIRLDSFTPPNWLNEHFAPVDGGGTWFNVVYFWDPGDPRVEELVSQIRAITPGSGDLAVGGNNAAVTDTVESVTGRVPLALGVVCLVTLVLLFFMTGSVVIPLKATLLNLLSLTATFGALVWIFQDGHLGSLLGITATGKIDVFTPILMFCIAYGLAMDYEVFLLARIKEEYDLTGDNEHAVRAGIGHTGPIVTAAAVLLALVFVAIASSGVAIVKMFGLGLALAVVSDAFLVRATLTPALMKLAGRANWWAPGVLRRFHLRWGIWENEPVPVPDASSRT